MVSFSPLLLCVWMDRTGALLLYWDAASPYSWLWDSALARRKGGGGGGPVGAPFPPRPPEPEFFVGESAENPDRSSLVLIPSDMVGGGLDPDSSSSVSMALADETPRLEMVDVLLCDLLAAAAADDLVLEGVLPLSWLNLLFCTPTASGPPWLCLDLVALDAAVFRDIPAAELCLLCLERAPLCRERCALPPPKTPPPAPISGERPERPPFLPPDLEDAPPPLLFLEDVRLLVDRSACDCCCCCCCCTEFMTPRIACIVLRLSPTSRCCCCCCSSPSTVGGPFPLLDESSVLTDLPDPTVFGLTSSPSSNGLRSVLAEWWLIAALISDC